MMVFKIVSRYVQPRTIPVGPMGININEAWTDCIDTFIEGLFALLMGEVFGIGLKLQEGKNTAA